MSDKELFDNLYFDTKKTNKVTHEQYKTICELHAKVFNHRYNEPCTCNPRAIKAWILDLKTHFYS